MLCYNTVKTEANKDGNKPSDHFQKVFKMEFAKAPRSTLQGKVYNFLERPKGWRCFLYHLTLFIMVLVCLSFSVLTTIDTYSKFAHEVLFWMEIVIVVTFAGEYVIRLWSAGCRSKYMGITGRIRFMGKPMSLIDLVVVSASVLVLAIGSKGQVFATSAIRGIRFIQILRMLHVDRQGGTWQLLGTVMFHHRQELVTTLYIGFLGLIFSSYFVYLAEKDDTRDDGDSDFGSYADALWWGVVTFTTIGYGDKVPKTWVGRAITAIFSVMIISFITLPSGIIGSGFALKVQQKQRQKQFSRQFRAAATLIQCAWRCHATDDEHSASWNVYVQKYAAGPNSAGRSKKGFNRMDVILWRKAHGEAASAVSTPTTDYAPGLDMLNDKGPYVNRAFSMEEVSIDSDVITVDSNENTETRKDRRVPNVEIQIGDTQFVKKLTVQQMNAIRWIRKTKLTIAVRKFQQSRKPYDVRDIMEQYSEGHSEVMVRIKELHRRMDHVLGKPLSNLQDFHEKHSAKPATMQTRLCHIEQQVLSVARPSFRISYTQLTHESFARVASPHGEDHSKPKFHAARDNRQDREAQEDQARRKEGHLVEDRVELRARDRTRKTVERKRFLCNIL